MDLFDEPEQTDEQRITAAGWVPASKSGTANGYWLLPGEGRVLSTELVL
jgi:hypothetical protein